MPKTITIDIINDKAMKLLEDLEQLQLIRLRKEQPQSASANWAKRYKGAMSRQLLAKVDNQLNALRSGWE